jgi:tetratricopeptide (TPR) repeat protein
MEPDEALERGFALFDMGRLEEALLHLRRAAAAAPDLSQIHSMIASAELQLGHAKQALQAAEAAVQTGPEEELGHRLRAVALLQLGRKRDARDSALAATRLDPEESSAYVVLASALQATGDEAGAVAAAEHAIELEPESSIAHHALGEVLLEQDRGADAARAFEAALALDPEDAETLNNLAVARLRSYDRFGTGEQFETAARLDPRLDVARHNLLHTGPAGRSHAYRRIAVGLLLAGALFALDAPVAGLVFVGLALIVEVARAVELQRVNPPTRALLRDDNRARRFKPARWDWRWPTRLRPWWWILLAKLPPPILLALNLVLLVPALADPVPVWLAILAVWLAINVRRSWRWYRRRVPGASSWRPPA